MYCKKCKKTFSDNRNFCTECGSPLIKNKKGGWKVWHTVLLVIGILILVATIGILIVGIIAGAFLLNSTQDLEQINPFSSSSSNTMVTLREVEDGDTVNIDYIGIIDGEIFEDTEGQGTTLTIGSGTYIDDFESQLIGAHIGETVEVKVTFPENYTPELSGKDATFEVTINSIYE